MQGPQDHRRPNHRWKVGFSNGRSRIVRQPGATAGNPEPAPPPAPAAPATPPAQAAGERALDEALGDLVRTILVEELERLFGRALLDSPPSGAPAAPGLDTPEAEGVWADSLVEPKTPAEERVAQRIRGTFAGFDGDVAEREMLERLTLGRTLIELRSRDGSAQTDSTPVESADLDRVDRLQRRILKLRQSLQNTRESIRVISMQGPREEEEGVASIHKMVQGLAQEDDLFAAKSDMLKEIFVANLKIRGKAA